MTIAGMENPPTRNKKLIQWVNEVAELTQPDRVEWCDGSQEEWDRLTQRLVAAGTLIRLNPQKRPNSLPRPLEPRRRGPRRGPHLHLLAARRGRRPHQQLAGPGRDARDAEGAVRRLHARAHDVRHPVLHGSARLAASRTRRGDHRLALRRGQHADHDAHGPGGARPHRRGRRLRAGAALRRVPAGRRRGKPRRRRVAVQRHQVHRPLPRDARDLVVRLRLRRQRAAGQEVLRAAHRLGDGPRRGLAGRAHAHPEAHRAASGEVNYLTAAFPSACGKTNLAMLEPTIPGWKVETIGDDIAWMRFGDDGRLYAINPEAGFFGVAPGTGHEDQRQRDRHAVGQLHLHQRRAHRRRRRLVGGAHRRDAGAPDRLEGQRLDAGVRRARRHPNARFTAPAAQCPSIADNWEDPAGVPISAILFGGRRATNVPLVNESLRLGARRVHRRHGRRPSRPRPPTGHVANCAATRSRCCRSAATTWPTTGATG